MLHWESLEAKNAVLTLQSDIDAWVEEVGDKCGDADSEVYIHAVFDFFSSSSHHTLPANLCVSLARNNHWLTWRVDHAELDWLFVIGTSNNAVYENTGEMDLVRVQLACRNNLFDLNDTSATSGGHRWIEIAGSFSELYVTRFVSTPSLDKCKVSGD